MTARNSGKRTAKVRKRSETFQFPSGDIQRSTKPQFENTVKHLQPFFLHHRKRRTETGRSRRSGLVRRGIGAAQHLVHVHPMAGHERDGGVLAVADLAEEHQLLPGDDAGGRHRSAIRI